VWSKLTIQCQGSRWSVKSDLSGPATLLHSTEDASSDCWTRLCCRLEAARIVQHTSSLMGLATSGFLTLTQQLVSLWKCRISNWPKRQQHHFSFTPLARLRYVAEVEINSSIGQSVPHTSKPLAKRDSVLPTRPMPLFAAIPRRSKLHCMDRNGCNRSNHKTSQVESKQLRLRNKSNIRYAMAAEMPCAQMPFIYDVAKQEQLERLRRERSKLPNSNNDAVIRKVWRYEFTYCYGLKHERAHE